MNCEKQVKHPPPSPLTLHATSPHWGLPRWLSGKESTCQSRRHKRLERHRFDSWVGEDPLEKEMATHSSILAWEIPQTEEPGGLQSMGLQRIGHDRATEHARKAC